MKNKYTIFVMLFVTLSLLLSQQLRVEKINGKYKKPIYLTAPQNQSDTLFIIEQGGLIQTIINGKQVEPLLDIRDQIHQPKLPGDERGLLGMALHPNFQINRKFYVNYVTREDVTIISDFTCKKNSLTSEGSSERVLLAIPQPYSNHNGGQLAFGPDGYLYIGIGDGGFAGDPESNGQNINTLFGTILRINIDEGSPYSIPVDNPFYNHDTAKPEIYCFGLRNPWRFSFDREKGDLYIGDVGQSSWEEINFIRMEDAAGINFGWNIMEGSHCYPPGADCNQDKLITPIVEYPNNANYIKTLIGWNQNNTQGCSVTGGYVYRGDYISKLSGEYFFGDYCTGKVWSFHVSNGKVQDYKQWEIIGIEEDLYLASFGEDGKGELYLINHTGEIYKITEAK